MLDDIARFGVLGLGAGAVYALTALGIVLIYRGSGVVNFAQGAVGMVGAFVFYDIREGGSSAAVAWGISVALAAALGVALHLLVMRPLRHAPALARLIATLGVLSILLAFGASRYGDAPQLVTKLLPVDAVTLWGEVSVGRDRLLLLGIAVVLTVVLAVVYRVTRFGLATTAVAESRQATAAQGISPDVIAAVNWAVGSVLGVVAAVLVVNISGLTVTGLALLVIPALAAALVGGLRSFPLTLAGGLLIGVLQAEVEWLKLYLTDRWGEVVTLDGWAASVPFLIIIAVLVIRGRALPLRSERAEEPPEVGDGIIRTVPLLVAAGLIGSALVVTSDSLVGALTTSAGIGIVVLSLVVVTGYTGQLSLAQFALAGMGGWVCAVLVADHGWAYGPAAVAGIAVAVPVGVLVGLPSLRTRGVNLAIATLGLALLIESQVLANPARTGGLEGLDLGVPEFFGLVFDPVLQPRRFALLALGSFTVLALAVANLRRGRTGRMLIAVRSNERAAAALGVNLVAAKVYAFALASAIAAVGGVLIVLRQPVAVFFPTFSVFESIFVVVYAVIGGIGFVLGAAIAGLAAPGGALITLVNDQTGILDTGEAVQIALGLGLLATLIVHPNGIASFRIPSRLRSMRRRRPAPRLGPAERGAVTPRTLVVRDLGVRFGGVRALDDASITVGPGEVVGLIGPNGAGKTTLIDAVTGFVSSTGTVELDGQSIDRWNPSRRARAGLSRSFQSLELFESLTVRENLQTASDRPSPAAWFRDLVHPGRAVLGGRAVAAVLECELEPHLDQRPRDLPYGIRRLVGMARAVAGGPSVLLLDEPAAGLDEPETRELGHLIRRLADDWGLAVLLVEHDVSLVLEVCDRVTVLDQGRVLAEGPPGEIRHDEAVVTAYLGSKGEEEPPMVTRERRARVDTPRTSPTSVEVLLRAEEMDAGYGDLAAVRGLDLELRAGEIVALLGPNGAGKTTTLLTVAGELPPLAGRLEVLGSTRRRPLHRQVRGGLGFVPAERSVIAGLSTRANLRLGSGTVDAAVELFPELDLLLDRRAGLLSGGEQQMLTLARALAAHPRLLLVDELSLGLAPLVVERLLAAVRRAADEGAGVLLVEQHTADALAVADRGVVLRRGRVALSGSAEELRNQVDELESAYLTGIA